jgi:hypothetical protein
LLPTNNIGKLNFKVNPDSNAPEETLNNIDRATTRPLLEGTSKIMAPTDPHQGGDLFDMAAEGTSMPNDAGKMNTIPSKPRPGENDRGGATNPTDIPRSFQDTGAGVEVQTGLGCVSVASTSASRRRDLSANPRLNIGTRYPLKSKANVCTPSETRI